MGAGSVTAIGRSGGWRLPRVSASEPWLLVALSSAAAVLLLCLGPPGTDFAAHAYQRGLFAAHGFSLWNNLWYSGRYSFITYSTLYYPLAAFLGIRLLAVLSVGVAVGAFCVVTGRRWGDSARWANRSVAAMVPAFVLSAAFPFLLGAALALLAIVSLQRRGWWRFAVLCPLVAASSPLAFVLLGIAVVGAGIGERCSRRSVVLGASILGLVTGVLLLLAMVFPSGARYPFPLPAFVPAMVFSVGLGALTWRVEEARSLRFIALLNGVACVAAFVVSSPLGEAMTRLRFVGLPLVLLALALRQWRPRGVAVLVVVLAAYWNVAPQVTSFANGIGDPSQSAGYWRPVTAFLQARLPPGYRVEVVDTERHWAAAYLPAAGIPLVRGWFRQDDFPQNHVLYGPLSATGYERWLRGLGVRFVVLTDATPDYSAQREASLLRSGRSTLRPVFRTAHAQIYAVRSARGVLTGPQRPRVLDLDQDRMTLRLRAAGVFRVAVRYSPYWRTSMGCIGPTGDRMLRLVVDRPGVVHLNFRVRFAEMLRTLTGESRRACASTENASRLSGSE